VCAAEIWFVKSASVKSVKEVAKAKSNPEKEIHAKGQNLESRGAESRGLEKPGSEIQEAERAERNDKRIHVALPVRITYWDKDKKPGLEMACTYDISPHGARISSLRCIKDTGEIIAIERGRNKAFCRVVWIGEPDTELKGQIGLQCVESERAMFENELRDLDTVYQVIPRDATVRRSSPMADKGNRRQQDRYEVEGVAELQKSNRGGEKAMLKNLSEMGCLVTTKQVLLPGTDLKLVLNVANYNLHLKGQVRHSLDLGIGIEFSEIRKGDQQMLKYLLQQLEKDQLEEIFDVEVQS
jgi:PilZ domain